MGFDFGADLAAGWAGAEDLAAEHPIAAVLTGPVGWTALAASGGTDDNIAKELASEAVDKRVAAGEVDPTDADALKAQVAAEAAPVIAQQGGAEAAAKATGKQILSAAQSAWSWGKWLVPAALAVAGLLVVGYVVMVVRSLIPRRA